MNTSTIRLIFWGLLVAPIALVAWRYDALPDPLPLIRNLRGGVAVWGVKSPLTAFHIAIMGVLMGAMLQTLIASARRMPDSEGGREYESLWTTMLGIAGAKSFIQGIELCTASPIGGPTREVAYVAITLGVVVIGLIPALMFAARIYGRTRFKTVGLDKSETALLLGLGVLYAAMVFVPLIISRADPLAV